MFEKILRIGPDALATANTKSPQSDIKTLSDLTTEMIRAQNENTYKERNMQEIDQILANVYQDDILKSEEDKTKYYFDLLDTWHGIMASVGREVKKSYTESVNLRNKSARLNGFDSATDEQLADYGEELEESLDRTWSEVKPLYQKLHAVVRWKLNQVFGDRLVSLSSPIPAHLLGGLMSQNWQPLFPLVRPNQAQRTNGEEIDLSGLEMAHYADEYFAKIGFASMDDEFFSQSVFEKNPEDSCDVSAWDLKNETFRISMCADRKRQDIRQMLDLMSKVHYFRAFQNQNIILRRPPIPSFDDALGEAFKISSMRHDKYGQMEPDYLNSLMYLALDKIPFLPFALTLEKWRWSIYDGKTFNINYQKKWDKLRLDEMGLMQPVKRDSADFDGGLKKQIPTGSGYIRYYVSGILQFQFLAAMCPREEIDCDLQNYEDVYSKVYPMMSRGATERWRDTLYDFTGQRDLDTGPLLAFFGPLEDYVDELIEEHNLVVGWENQTWMPQDELYVEVEKEQPSTEGLALINLLSPLLLSITLTI